MHRAYILRRRFYEVFEYIDWDEEEENPPKIQSGTVKIDPDARMHTSDTGINYYISLPEGAERCLVYTQFYRLVNNAKTWKDDNIELREGMYFLIYSHAVEKYFLRQVYDKFDPKRIRQYIVDKNLYLINKEKK